MTLAFIAIIFGLALLVWSADRFVEGSASTARHFGVRQVTMVLVGAWRSSMAVASLRAAIAIGWLIKVNEKQPMTEQRAERTR